MSNKRKIPVGISLFATYQFLHSLALILGSINSIFEISSIPEIANVEAEINKEILIIVQIIGIAIGVWGLSLAINLFKLNEKARRRLVLYSKIILVFSIFLFLLGLVPMILIVIISLIVLKYLNSKKVKRAFSAVDSQTRTSDTVRGG